jgi:hypothetical protein
MYMAAASSKGNCYLCGAELSKTAMKNHLVKSHGGDKDTDKQECHILKIEGAYNKEYWLYIDVPAAETLDEVDYFLRHIWLECCGHMSAFFYPKHEEISKGRKLQSFAAGDTFLHHYDFGTTTETLITIMGSSWRKKQKEPVRLLARNVPPVFQCASCGKPAEYICTECMYNSGNPFFCAKCSEEHEDGEEMMLPVVNSPRMGECGYDGELDIFTFNPATIVPKT